MNEHRLRGFIKTCRAAGLNAQETTALMSLHKIAGEFDTRPAYRRAFFKTAAQLAQQHGVKEAEEAAAPGGAGTFWGSGAGHALAGAGVSALLALLFSGRGNRIRNAILAFLGGGALGTAAHMATGGLHQMDFWNSLSPSADLESEGHVPSDAGSSPSADLESEGHVPGDTSSPLTDIRTTESGTPTTVAQNVNELRDQEDALKRKLESEGHVPSDAGSSPSADRSLANEVTTNTAAVTPAGSRVEKPEGRRPTGSATDLFPQPRN